MKKIVSFLGIAFAFSAIAATQTSKEYVDRRDNEILSHAKEYTDDSVRGLANETNIPTKVSQLQNDSGYVNGSVTNGLLERANSYTDEETRKALVEAKNYTDNATNGQSKVMSVNGRTGKVVLSSVDVHARPDNWTPSAEDVGAQPTLFSGTNIKTVNGNSLLGSGNIEINGGSVDGSARPLPRYLHALDFADTYPDDAAWYYAQPQDYGSCSAVRDGGFLYRNYDWKFDDSSEFVVKVSAANGRFASVGVANVGTNLTEDAVTSGKPSRYYKCLPGRVVDGINENGVVCEVNVVGGDPHESGWPTNGSIHCLGVVRWVLDHATNAASAAYRLAAEVYFPSGFGQNFHWMVADERETWIVENGHPVNTYTIIHRVMTNFPTLVPNEDFPGEWEFEPGAVLDKYGKAACPGSERWIKLAFYPFPNITNVWYTNAYRRETNPPWVSDLADVLSYTNDIYNAWASHPKEYFRNKTNGGEPWWQTVHTSIYDITNRILRVAVQEQDDWYVFAVDQANVDLTPIEAQIAALQSGKADEFGRWTSIDFPSGITLEDQPVFMRTPVDHWEWLVVGSGEKFSYTGSDDATDGTFVSGSRPLGFHASRHRVLRTGDAATPQELTTKQDKITAFGVLKGDGQGGVSEAAKSSTSIDPANADYRDPQDNACHKTEFTEWVFNLPEGATIGDLHFDNYWSTESTNWWATGTYLGEPCNWIDTDHSDDVNAQQLSLFRMGDGNPSFTATRSAVCTDGKKFVTENVVDGKVSSAVSTNNPAFVSAVRNTPTSGMPDDMPTDWGIYGTVGAALAALAAFVKWAKAKIVAVIGDDGKPTDTFATDLLGKQVANAKVRYKLSTVSSTTMSDRTTNFLQMNGNATLTFPEAIVIDGEKYSRDFLLRVKVTTAGSLTLPADIALAPYSDDFDFTKANDWLIAFTEEGVDANGKAEFYIRAIG